MQLESVVRQSRNYGGPLIVGLSFLLVWYGLISFAVRYYRIRRGASVGYVDLFGPYLLVGLFVLMLGVFLNHAYRANLASELGLSGVAPGVRSSRSKDFEIKLSVASFVNRTAGMYRVLGTVSNVTATVPAQAPVPTQVHRSNDSLELDHSAS